MRPGGHVGRFFLIEDAKKFVDLGRDFPLDPLDSAGQILILY